MLKKEIRIIAFDDCAFSFKQKKVLLVGVIFRGGQFIDGLISTRIEKDGVDVTQRISDSVISSRHYDQLNIIMLNGITYGGFNVVDINKLSNDTQIPVIAIQRHKPEMKKFLLAMKRFDNYSKRSLAVRMAGSIYKYNKVYYQKSCLTKKECEDLLRITCTRSNVPEPIRVAHLIASGLSRNIGGGISESKGRA